MAIPTLITELSTTAAANSPAGSDSPSTLDDIQRAHASFIAQLRDGKATAGANTDITSLSGLSGNINFTGTGNRITGDFSNATIANRMMFQTSTVNGASIVPVLPNGTNNAAGYMALPYSTIINNASPYGLLACTTSEVKLAADQLSGGGGYLPMTFNTGGVERMRIDASGNVLVTGSGGLGYGAGSGGTVTQATSKSTAVTLNKPTGRITMTADTMSAGAIASFNFNNSLFGPNDVLVLTISNASVSNIANYNIWAHITGAVGVVVLKNISAGSLAEAVAINFALIKGSTT